MLYAIDADKDLIEVPLSLRVLAKVGRALSPNTISEYGPKSVDPETDAFMANVDPTLVK